MTEPLRLALPNKGLMKEGAMACLAQAGFPVQRTHERQYTGRIATLPGVELHFQRNADMYDNLAAGQLDAAITGYDNFVEAHVADDPVLVVEERLGFGNCELVLAVPERWLDIVSIGDLAELATRRRAQQRPLRIATKYTHTTRSWLHQRGITQCLLVEASGAIEAAPGLGYADCIVDLTASGVTLRENRLKRIRGGLLLRSEGCLIVSRTQLLAFSQKIELLSKILDGIWATRRAAERCCLQACIPDLGDLPQRYPKAIVEEVKGEGGESYLLRLTVPLVKKWDVIRWFRDHGADEIQEIPLVGLYEPENSAQERLKQILVESGEENHHCSNNWLRLKK